ncbi:MAG: MFS transporter [Flavobacteriaceae bacterium]|nr:MFS transporter [Flavobacteriaceae bacterium]
MLKIFFKKSFNIREGEIQIALLMQLYIFIVISVLLLVKPTVTALFLTNLGPENLPYGYLLVAVVAVFTSLFYNQLVTKFSIKIIAIATIILFSACFFILSYVVYEQILHSWVLYFYYLSLSLFGVLVTSQFWVIANVVFDIREAKRLFGFIGAGAIAGGIFGGYLTTFLAKFFGNGMVIFVAAAMLLLCLPLILWIWKIRVNQLNKFIKADRKSAKKNKLSGNSWKIVFQSKHLLNLSVIVGISVLVAKLVDYQFSDFSHRAYADSDELASFFGFWFSSFNIIALLIQLFLTNRFMARFGVSTNMLLLPLCLAVGSVLFLIFPELWVLILIKGVDGSFKQSINKAAFELSILPVPFDVKKQAKPFIDVVVDSIATGLAGFLLLFVIKKMNVNSSYITLIIIVCLAVWLFFIYRLRESYFDAFRTNISSLLGVSDKKVKKTSRISSSSAIIQVLKSGDEKGILKILPHLSENLIDAYKPYILNLLDHPSNRVKAEVIKEFYSIKNETALEKIKQLIATNNDDEVVYEAMEYFLMHSAKGQEQVYLGFLNNEKDYIKNAALLCLARASRSNKALEKKYELNERIESQIKEFSEFEEIQRSEEIAALLLTIGYSGNKRYDHFIDKYLASKEPLLRTYAIKASGLSRSEDFIDKLLHLMPQEAYQKDVIRALQSYGESIVEKLFQKDLNEELENEIRGYVPKIIESFDTDQSVDVLNRLLKSKDVLVRLNAAKSLENMEEHSHHIKISDKKLKSYVFEESLYFKNTLSAIQSLEKSLNKKGKKPKKGSDAGSDEFTARQQLIKHLKAQLDYSLQTIFYLLSIKYLDSDMKIAFKGIKNDTEESRINTIEFLENMLQVDLKNELLPLLEYHFLPDSEANLKLESIPESKILTDIIKERSAVSKILVLKLLQYVHNNSHKATLKKLTKHKNPKVKNLAKKILNTA